MNTQLMFCNRVTAIQGERVSPCETEREEDSKEETPKWTRRQKESQQVLEDEEPIPGSENSQPVQNPSGLGKLRRALTPICMGW